MPLLTPEEEQKQRTAVVAEARSWKDTPFVHRGKVKGQGCDCAALIIETYFVTGHMPQMAMPQYHPDWWRHAKDPEQYIVETAKKYFREITAAEARPGDWCVVKLGKAFAHCAILTGADLVVEAWPSRNKVSEINPKKEPTWRHRQRRYYSPWGK